LHTFNEVLGAARWRDNSVSHCFTQFILRGTGFLRDREVLGESVRAVDRHGTGNPDQFAGFDIEDFREFKIQDLFADFHGFSLWRKL
jgi:hypothetical protein